MLLPSPPAGVVALVRWPIDADALVELREAGCLRLVLVADGAQPPERVGEDPREDWVRLPSDEHEVGLRVRHLLARAPTQGSEILHVLFGRTP